MHTFRKILGGTMLVIPFLAIFIVTGLEGGWWLSLAIFGGAAVFVLCVIVGCDLLFE